MKERKVVMVINNIFEGHNMLIVKSEGDERITRFDKTITPEILEDYLQGRGIDKDSCVINVVEEDWKKNPMITRW